MALQSCPECNGEVSDAATACPHCGYPVGNRQEEESASETADSSGSPDDNWGCVRVGSIGFAVALALVIWYAASGDDHQSETMVVNDDDASSVSQADVESVTSDEPTKEVETHETVSFKNWRVTCFAPIGMEKHWDETPDEGNTFVALPCDVTNEASKKRPNPLRSLVLRSHETPTRDNVPRNEWLA